ncbi:ring-cleaving dioxygenase [Fibrella sp. USSR17]
MSTLINGLHHVTAIAGDTHRNVDFYRTVLGLRLLKKTVNFDAPDVYHLYYGDETGSPGSIYTSFPYGNIPRGRKGAGQLTYTAFSVPVAGMSFWLDRLHQFQIAYAGPNKRFDEMYVRFEDYDGMGIELVFTDADTRPGYTNGQIAIESAIRGFHTVTLEELKPDRTVELLTGIMQHRLVAEEGDLFRYEAGTGGSGRYVDIHVSSNPVRAFQGAGSVHHVAFSTDSDETQLIIQEQLAEGGYHVTPVQDRNYFHSIYFREPGGVLFEVATNPPGFAIDESPDSLGTSLMLPPQYEARRAQLESVLPAIN